LHIKRFVIVLDDVGGGTKVPLNPPLLPPGG